MQNLILFDWLSATIKLPIDRLYDAVDYNNSFLRSDIEDGRLFIEMLGMGKYEFQKSDGVKGFSKRLWFDGISIHLPSEKMPLCWLEMSGQGCRAFETYGHGDWLELFQSLQNFKCNITRIDIAHDDHEGILKMPTLIEDTLNESYVSKARSHEVLIKMDDVTHERACSIYHGSQKSNTIIRIYDKAKQLDIKNEHWIRTEIQLRDENASGAVKEILSNCSVGDLFCGVLLRYIRYVEENPNDMNKWRWGIKDYWSNLVGNAAPIKVAATPGAEYNMTNLENFVFAQAGNAIKTYIEAFGIDKFVSKVKEYKPYITNPKYRKLLEDIQNAS